MTDTLENLKSLLADYICGDANEIETLDTFEDLGIESLDHAQVIMACEEHFEIRLPESDAAQCKTVIGLYGLILTAQGAEIE